MTDQAAADYAYDNTQTYLEHQKIHGGVEVLSFDIWNTLLRSNPQFGAKRIELIAQYLLPEGCFVANALQLVATAVKTADTLLDTIQESQGNQASIETRLDVVADQLRLLLWLADGQEYDLALGMEREKDLTEAIYEAFRANPPTLWEPDFAQTFAWFAQHIPVVVVSNTGYIPGHMLRDVLRDLGINPTYCYFSDEIGVGKPAPTIFNPLFQFPNLTDAKNVLHVGDSYPADYYGATACGFSAVLYDRKKQFLIKDGDDTPALAWRGPDGVMRVNSLVSLSQVISISTVKTNP
jgi:putative hydrolase of the HAD superfamily